jgi:hypothetical protein
MPERDVDCVERSVDTVYTAEGQGLFYEVGGNANCIACGCGLSLCGFRRHEQGCGWLHLDFVHLSVGIRERDGNLNLGR